MKRSIKHNQLKPLVLPKLNGEISDISAHTPTRKALTTNNHGNPIDYQRNTLRKILTPANILKPNATITVATD